MPAFLEGCFPWRMGGTALGLVDLTIASEELAAVDVNVPSALLGTGLGLQPLIRYGTPAQKEQFLRMSATCWRISRCESRRLGI